MKITSISIKHFRSIAEIEIEAANLNVLVGQNNHGKTNFLSALNWFYNGGSYESHQRKGSGQMPYIQIEFDDIPTALAKMKNEKNRKTLEVKLKDKDKVILVRTVDDTAKTYRKILNDDGSFDDPGTGFDRALNDFLPTLEYVQTENNLRDVLKYGKTTQIGTMLSSVLNEILASGDTKYKDFIEQFYELFGSKDSKIYEELNRLAVSVQKYLQKQFPETTDVEFEVKNPDLNELFKNFSAKVDDGVVTEAYEKGDGMQRALMLAIIQTYADYRRDNNDIKNFIFLIDEGELHLHPRAQRHLKEALEELAQDGDQIFLTTHSSVLIVEENLKEHQKIFRVQKFEDGVTQIDEQDAFGKQNIVYELLGGSPADLLLPTNFLIVEGPSEVEFLTKVLSRHYPQCSKIKVLPARGDLSQTVQLVAALEKVFTALTGSIYEQKYQVLIDANKISAPQFEDLLRKIPDFKPDIQLHELPVGSLEEYYPNKEPDQCNDPTDSRTYMETWTFTPADVSRFDTGRKVSVARRIANEITKEQFENEMSAIHEAVQSTLVNSI
jgi:putative ATP-dependent endonuclease of the OLD family